MLWRKDDGVYGSSTTNDEEAEGKTLWRVNIAGRSVGAAGTIEEVGRAVRERDLTVYVIAEDPHRGFDRECDRDGLCYRQKIVKDAGIRSRSPKVVLATK